MKTDYFRKIEESLHHEMFLRAEDLFYSSLDIGNNFSIKDMLQARRLYFYLGINNSECELFVELNYMLKNESIPDLPNPNLN